MNRPLQQTMPASPAKPETVSHASAAPSHEPDEELRRLRELLLTSEQEQIAELRRRLDDPEVRADEAARILAEAVRRASRGDSELSVALRPLVEAGLQESVRQNPSVIVDTIYPILGPAIRKAVASAVRGTVESLNRVAEHSFTWRGLRWRIEAWRTGQPIAEVALKHSVVYRVEQILLIHRETGLLLQTVGADPAARNEDLISGMLTAIQDFVHDSFSVERDQNLDRLEVGDFQVWIERGPRAILAAVIRGSAPRSLRARLVDAVASVHRDLRARLERFDGDSAPFEAARPTLEECLEEEFRDKRTGPSPALLVVTGVLVALLAWAGFLWWQSAQRWSRFTAAVAAEAGLVLVERDGGRASLLRDPLAAEPASLAAAAGFEAGEPLLQVRPYLSVEPLIVEQRVRESLAPPDSVRLSYDAGKLIASGRAPAEWIERLHSVGPTLPGISGVSTDGLRVSGSDELREAVRRAQALRVVFPESVVTITGSQQESLDAMEDELQRLLRLAQDSGFPVAITIVGRADRVGDLGSNERLSEARAESLRRALVQRGLPAQDYPTRGELVDAPGERTASLEVRMEEWTP